MAAGWKKVQKDKVARVDHHGQKWHEVSDGRMRYEKGGTMYFDQSGSEKYRAGYDAIDWSDDGKGEK